MTHLQRYMKLLANPRHPGGLDNALHGHKLAKWSDMCEAAEVGVAIPGLDQTLVMWSIRKALRGTGVEVRYNPCFAGVDFYRRELRRRVPNFDLRVFTDRAVEVVVPEIDFHYRFDAIFYSKELQFARHIIGVLKEGYEI